MSEAGQPTQRKGAGVAPEATRAQRGGDWEVFLAALREIPSVKRACKTARVSRQAAYKRREKHPEFAAAWKDAEEDAVDHLLAICWQRAAVGWKPDDPERERPSDDLAKFLLRAHRPDRYSPVVTLKATHSLAELRAMPDDELFALARRNGLMPEER